MPEGDRLPHRVQPNQLSRDQRKESKRFKVSALPELAKRETGKVREREDAFATTRVARTRRQAVPFPNPTICKSLSPQLSRAESPSEPRLILGSVVYFFLGATFAARPVALSLSLGFRLLL